MTALILIIGVTVISFLSSLDNGFVNWDDNVYVTENHLIKDLSWNNMKEIFSTVHAAIYCPLVIFSYALEYAAFGLDPFVYHFTNLLLHVSNGLLVFWVMVVLSNHVSLSLITALLFGVHPLHVESVAWVTERKDVLSTLFFLGAVLCYLRSHQKERPLLYYLSLGLFGFSLLAKPMGVTLPLVLLLCDYLTARRLDWHTLGEKVPFFVLSLLFGLVALWTQHMEIAVNPPRSVSLGGRLLLACWSLLFYLGKTFLPLGLSALYPYPPEISIRFATFSLPPLVLLGLAAGVWASRRYTRQVVFGSLFFLITLLPVIRLVPKVGPEVAADRFMYVPSIGLFYLVGVVFCWLYGREIRWERGKRESLIALLGAVIVALSVLTWQRCNLWQDSETLWLSVLEVHPKVPIAHSNLGVAYERKGLLEQAIAQYQKALALDPKYEEAYSNLGVAYERKGLLEQAIAQYQKALALNPKYVWAHSNLGVAYEKKGLLEQAIAQYQKALALDPKDAVAHNNLGNAYGRRGLLEEAIAEYQKAIASDPMYAKPHYNLGIVYRMQGKLEAAMAEFRKALALDPTYARAHHSLALAYFDKGSYREAIEHYDQARELGYLEDLSLAEALSPYR